MPRLLNLPFSTVDKLMQALQTAGLTEGQVAGIITTPRHAKIMVDALVKATAPVNPPLVAEQPGQHDGAWD